MESIGEMIRTEVERQGRTVAWMAGKLSCHRSNIYNIYQRSNIDLELLVRLSHILSHNFLKDVSLLVEKELQAGCTKE